MLSILIPTYNYDITSLVAVLYKQLEEVSYAYEIIVVDDASTKEELMVKNRTIKQYPHCTCIELLENKGRTATRNFLAQKANYAWLLFMDADVLPKKNTFIQTFNLENTLADVVFGGISYENNPPEKSKMLRWKYGRAREAKTVSTRKKMPYLSIISQCFLIKKKVFLQANTFFENTYGMDVLFSRNLENLNVQVLHIDNPIIHYGLETNTSFILKTKKGLETLSKLEKERKIPNNYRPIQKAYVALQKRKLGGVFGFAITGLEFLILKNLNSRNPSLLLFDVLKLNYYLKIKKSL